MADAKNRDVAIYKLQQQIHDPAVFDESLNKGISTRLDMIDA